MLTNYYPHTVIEDGITSFEQIILNTAKDLERQFELLLELKPAAKIIKNKLDDFKLYFEITDFITKDLIKVEAIVNIRKAVMCNPNLGHPAFYPFEGCDKDYQLWYDAVTSIIETQRKAIQTDWDSQLKSRLVSFSPLSVYE